MIVDDSDEPDAHEIDWAREWKYRAVAVPVAFLLAFAFHASATGHWLQRTFLTMVPHELGHAFTAWWSGYPAAPSLWKTIIGAERSVAVMLAVAVLEAAIVWRGWRTERWWLVGLGIALALAQLLGVTASSKAASAAFSFGGDAGAMVIGALLVLAFFAPAGSKLRRGGLRWGLLAIGAAALVDTASTWWTARTDLRAIPFGEIEGVGLSDASKLDQVHGWSTQLMVERFVLVAYLAFASVFFTWLWGVWTARLTGSPPTDRALQPAPPEAD